MDAEQTGISAFGPCRFNDLAITTALMVKRVFSMPLTALQGFVVSIFLVSPCAVKLSALHLPSFVEPKPKLRPHLRLLLEAIRHLAIDATGLKVYGGLERKVKHGTDGKRKSGESFILQSDTSTFHEGIAAELSLSTVTDRELPRTY
ncbi:transposase [Vibrio lentus]|nr:transposase [Vibrio lentus]